MRLLKCCWKSETTHDHPPLLNQVKSKSELPSLNVGIYLDENSITVGTIDEGKHLEIILQIPAEITFLRDSIVIGGDSEKNSHEINNFRMYELIKDIHQPNPKITLESEEFTLSREEVLEIFFQHLFAQIRSQKFVESVDNLVLTSLFALTSAEKERLKVSLLATAGFNSVRILSSLLTTAIAYAAETSFYTRTPEKAQSLIVAQYTETSFFLSLIDITQDFIATRRSFSSANLLESQDGAFVQYHRSLFHNQAIKPDQAHYVLKAYKKACRVLCSEKTLKKINLKILKAAGRNCFLDDILSSIFDEVNVQETFAKSGPLTGASLLASRTTPNSIIPSSVTVCDGGFTSLIFSHTLSQKVSGVTAVKNFCPRIVLTARVPATITKTTEVVLQEEFLKGKLIATVGKWNLRIKNQMKSGVVHVRLQCLVDEDGIFKVEPHDDEPDAIWTRLDAPDVSFGDDSGARRILYYYENIKETDLEEIPDLELHQIPLEPDVGNSMVEFYLEEEEEVQSTRNLNFKAPEVLESEQDTVYEGSTDTASESDVTSTSSESDSVESDESEADDQSESVTVQKEEIQVEEHPQQPDILSELENEAKADEMADETLPAIFESIRSYNFGTATLKNKTELWLAEAEMLYDSSIKEFKPSEKSRSGVHRIHERLKVDAIDAFKLKFRKHGLELTQDLLNSLESTLNNKFQKLIDGLATESGTLETSC